MLIWFVRPLRVGKQPIPRPQIGKERRSRHRPICQLPISLSNASPGFRIGVSLFQSVRRLVNATRLPDRGQSPIPC